MATVFSESLSPKLKHFWTLRHWCHLSLPRIFVCTVSTALLFSAISVYGDAISPGLLELVSTSQWSQARQLMSEVPKTRNTQSVVANALSESFFTYEEFLSAKAKIWKAFQAQVRHCRRSAPQVQLGDVEHNSKHDACVEQARRERRTAQALARAKTVPAPHSAEDSRIALY